MQKIFPNIDKIYFFKQISQRTVSKLQFPYYQGRVACIQILQIPGRE